MRIDSSSAEDLVDYVREGHLLMTEPFVFVEFRVREVVGQNRILVDLCSLHLVAAGCYRVFE